MNNTVEKTTDATVMQEYPSLQKVQATLYRERRCFVPPEPRTVQDLDFSGEMFLLDQSEESIIKGDTLISADKRVVLSLSTSNDILDILAQTKIILGDGTFQICPKLWTQVFNQG